MQNHIACTRIAITAAALAALTLSACTPNTSQSSKGSAVAGGNLSSGRVGSTSWDGDYGDVRAKSGAASTTPAATNPATGNPANSSPAPNPSAAPQAASARSTSLPSLADEEARRAQREVERVANLARLTELVPTLKAPDWITAGKVVKGDQTIIPASGTGATLKDAYDAAVVSAQRELLKQAGIPAARVVIGRGAYQRIPDGPGSSWQVFLEAIGVGGTGPLPILKLPAPTDKPPVDLIGE